MGLWGVIYGAGEKEEKIQPRRQFRVFVFGCGDAIAVYTFILQKSYAHNTLEAAVERNISCSDGMHQVISNKFTREDYAEINDRADMKLERYQAL